MANRDINKIKPHLKGLKSQLEQDLAPIKIKTIVIETSSLLKVSLIDDNMPIIMRIKVFNVLSNSFKDKLYLRNMIREMIERTKALKFYFFVTMNYRKTAKMRDIEKNLRQIEKGFGKFDNKNNLFIMESITSTTFYNTWLEVVNRNKSHLLSNWRTNKPFTSLMLHNDDSIICQVAEELKLLCYNRDYYALDAVLYKKEDKVPINSMGLKIPDDKVCLSDIQIAFEHENTFKSGIYQEISHLLITNAKLKVLVSYPEDTPSAELDYLHEIILNTRHADELSKNENFLIIFGYENGFAWEGFVFKKDKWKKLN